ncbi:uclacyanin 1-like [Prosopis cineraria]|uniref:uclacyanin 1-like n=1 Tax=Prosopis cineraria TaxID=364024 RepID=UPI00240EE368|nr:uclacyanin 1-like [Prosopis cineraria]
MEVLHLPIVVIGEFEDLSRHLLSAWGPGFEGMMESGTIGSYYAKEAKDETNNVVMLISIIIMTKMMIISEGAVYKVGGSSGWTSIGRVDYKNWAASKIFQVGDTIIFEYNPEYHNVMRVTYEMYKSCNVSAGTPIETFNTGNDSIKINNHGHNLFMCGFPGHCLKGQKVDINVIRISATKPPSPSTTNDDDDDDDDLCPCPNKAAPFTASFGLIGLALSFLALAGF